MVDDDRRRVDEPRREPHLLDAVDRRREPLLEGGRVRLALFDSVGVLDCLREQLQLLRAALAVQVAKLARAQLGELAGLALVRLAERVQPRLLRLRASIASDPPAPQLLQRLSSSSSSATQTTPQLKQQKNRRINYYKIYSEKMDLQIKKI